MDSRWLPQLINKPMAITDTELRFGVVIAETDSQHTRYLFKVLLPTWSQLFEQNVLCKMKAFKDTYKVTGASSVQHPSANSA